ncbi:MAG: FlgD immunoglobulin-like domain containing protein, partial [Terrimicrobiaceae bacterium]
MRFRLHSLVLAFLASLAMITSGSGFSWNLAEEGLVSAGIYSPEGNLVRVLWTMKRFPAGSYQSSWDGLKDDGSAAPAGEYHWKLVVNRSVYTNLSTIGNTGQPANSFGHVPFLIEGVAVDGQNRIYTVHDWNEAGHDVKRWNPETG